MVELTVYPDMQFTYSDRQHSYYKYVKTKNDRPESDMRRYLRWCYFSIAVFIIWAAGIHVELYLAAVWYTKGFTLSNSIPLALSGIILVTSLITFVIFCYTRGDFKDGYLLLAVIVALNVTLLYFYSFDIFYKLLYPGYINFAKATPNTTKQGGDNVPGKPSLCISKRCLS